MNQEVQGKKTRANKKKDSDYCEGVDFNFAVFFFGLVVVLVGIALLTDKLGLLPVSFNFALLWPLFIIFIGLLFVNKKNLIADIFAVLVILFAFFVILLAMLTPSLRTGASPSFIFPDVSVDNSGIKIGDYYLADSGFSKQSPPAVQTETPVEAPKAIPVDLFYYNKEADPNGECGSAAVLPVSRAIPVVADPIAETINLLLKGDISPDEKNRGFVSEFPNADFELISSVLKNGNLTLEFSEVPGFTDGGSCRMSILMAEITKTAEQFSEVKKVIFEPETLFQP
ncbi:MAG: GerMN domain-containing protein [Candidatus Pacebacteria bacterium]|nr:GerMN domain-containing protein [Candidatus Paceibacterota bacterium]